MMRIRKSKRVYTALGALTVALLVSSCSAGTGGTTEPSQPGNNGGGEAELSVIHLGAIVPSSGPFSEWGIGNTVALEMLEEQVNDAGGINGHPISITIYDDGADPAQATDLVRKLAGTDKVLAIAGPLTSSAVEVAFPVANKMSVVATSQASAKPGVAAQNRPWGFRNTIDEGVLGSQTVKYWQETYDIGTAALIYDAKDATATSSGTKTFPALLDEYGVDLLNADDLLSFSTGDVDVSAQVTKLKALNPDGVVITADYSQTLTVLREMVRQNFIRPVVSTSQAISTAILTGAPELPIVAPATYYVGAPEAEAQDFTKNLIAALESSGHGNIEPTMYDANIYEIMQMYISAIKELGLTGENLEQDREQIMNYMTDLRGFSGLVGEISFNDDGDAIKKFFVLVGQDGAWTPALICESGDSGCSAL